MHIQSVKIIVFFFISQIKIIFSNEKVWGFFQTANSSIQCDASQNSEFQTVSAATKLECLLECAIVDSCVNVAFDDVTHECRLFNSSGQDCMTESKVKSKLKVYLLIDTCIYIYHFHFQVLGTFGTRECEELPCGVGGNCIQHYRGFTCDCLDGFGGENCSIGKILVYLNQTFFCPCNSYTDYCELRACQNGGVCVKLENSSLCTCPSPFTGAQCETGIHAIII